MIGEIGGNAEEAAAEFVRTHMKKPVVGFIAGQTGLPDAAWPRRSDHLWWQGHCGRENCRHEKAGLKVAKSPADIGETLASVLE